MATISPFRAALPDLTDIISFDDFFGSAKRKFPLYLSDGIYQQADNTAVYIYRIKRAHRSHTGVLACADVRDYVNGLIKRHENTLAAKEAKMMHLFKERQASIKPILLTYPNVLEIDAVINRITSSSLPSFSIPFQDEEHIFWEISDEFRINTLKELFQDNIKETYICDGHHRAKTSEIFYRRYIENQAKEPAEFNNMLVAYFPASEIEIHNYNRVITNLGNLTEEEFLRQLKQYYKIKKVDRYHTPLHQYSMGMLLGKHWYELELLKKHYPKAGTPTNQTLDVHFLNEFVLEGILNIEDIRTEPDIKYVEGPKGAFGLERRVREGRAKVGFNLYPVALEDLIKISDEEDTLPPKSTWIEPRMRNGFIAHLYEAPDHLF